MDDVFALGEFFQFDALLTNPFPPGFLMSELLFQLVILDEATLEGVCQQHGTWAQATLANHSGRIDVQDANLAGEDDEPIRGDHIPTWPETIPVESRAHEGTVSEDQSGWAVPWLHEVRVVLIEVSNRGVHVGLVFPGFWNHHHHGVGQGTTR